MKFPALLAPTCLVLPLGSTPQQGPCTTGCDVDNIGILNKTVVGPNGVTIIIQADTEGGDCLPMLTEAGIKCIGGGCDATVMLGVSGLGEGYEVRECHGKVAGASREDCKSPAGTADASGQYGSFEAFNSACGSGTNYFSVLADGVFAKIEYVCEPCDM